LLFDVKRLAFSVVKANTKRQTLNSKQPTNDPTPFHQAIEMISTPKPALIEYPPYPRHRRYLRAKVSSKSVV